MNWKTGIACLAIAAAASLGAQQATSSTSTSTTTTKTTTTTGEVTQYEAGKTIVIRDANGRMVTYNLDSGLTVPSDIQIGRKVTIYSSPVDGSLRVQKITTVQTTNPDGSTSSQTRVKDEPSSSAMPAQTSDTSAQSSNPPPSNPPPAPSNESSMSTQTTTTTKTTRVSGKVTSYEPGQSITIVGPGSKTTTYTITTDSQLPTDVAVGKQVTVETATVSGKPVARTVTYRTTTKTTHTKTVSPK